MPPGHDVRPRARPRTIQLGILLCLLIAAGGCARNMVRATKLPQEYAAPEVENVQTIDLSKLSAPSVTNESIDCGDILDVTITTSVSGPDDRPPVTMPVRVGEDGYAKIPLIGPVPIAGLELAAAEQSIAAAGVQRGVYRDPTVTVMMMRQRVNKVTVLGAVESPGVYELARGSSALLNALIAAGGLSDKAGSDVELRRPVRVARGMPGPVAGGTIQAGYTQPQPSAPAVIRGAGSTRVNLSKAAQEGQGGYYLDDGDVVMVYKRDPHPVHVIGLVREAGEIELPVDREMRLLDALAKAKGVSSQVADRVHVIRKVPGREMPIVIQVSLREAKTAGKGNLRLASGDIVSVEQTPMTAFYDVLNNFVRFGISGSVPLF